MCAVLRYQFEWQEAIGWTPNLRFHSLWLPPRHGRSIVANGRKISPPALPCSVSACLVCFTGTREDFTAAKAPKKRGEWKNSVKPRATNVLSPKKSLEDTHCIPEVFGNVWQIQLCTSLRPSWEAVKAAAPATSSKSVCGRKSRTERSDCWIVMQKHTW